MPFKLYSFAVSQPSRSVRLLLAEHEIKYEMEEVDILGEKSPEFLKVNPGGYVPILVDGDFVLTEGAAILTYICQTHKLTDWLPEDPKVQAKVNQWMNWHHGATRTATTDVVRPTLNKTEVKDETLKKSLDTMTLALEKAPFLAGTQKPTIADLLILTEIDQLAVFEAYDVSPWPKIKEWVDNVGKGLPKSYETHMTEVKAFVAALG